MKLCDLAKLDQKELHLRFHTEQSVDNSPFFRFISMVSSVLHVLSMYIDDIYDRFASTFEYIAKFAFSKFGCRKSLAAKSRFEAIPMLL